MKTKGLLDCFDGDSFVIIIRLEKAISNDVFTKDELQRFAGFMQLAVEEMQKAKELGIVRISCKLWLILKLFYC